MTDSPTRRGSGKTKRTRSAPRKEDDGDDVITDRDNHDHDVHDFSLSSDGGGGGGGGRGIGGGSDSIAMDADLRKDVRMLIEKHAERRANEGSVGVGGKLRAKLEEHKERVERSIARRIEGIVHNEVVREGRKVVASSRDRIAAQGQNLRKRVSEKRQDATAVVRRVVTGDGNKRVRDHVRSKVAQPPVVKMIDKISFTLGVLNIIATEFVVLRYPEWLWAWHSLWLPSLLCIRYFVYKSIKYQYFMLDFCYFVQVLIFINLYLAPKTPWLFQSIFVFSFGPIAMAILAWRNSLVFHSLDKITSLGIHAFPSLLCFTMRWMPNQQAEVCDVPRDDGSCHLSYTNGFLIPAVLYALWQFLYVLKTEVVSRTKLEGDVDLQTSLRYFINHSSMLHLGTRKLCRNIGVLAPKENFDSSKWKTKIVFMATQFVYTIVTALPATLFYNSYSFQVGFLVFVYVASVWNGACYYIETFSQHYNLKFAPKQQPDHPHDSPLQQQQDGGGSGGGSGGGDSSLLDASSHGDVDTDHVQSEGGAEEDAAYISVGDDDDEDDVDWEGTGGSSTSPQQNGNITFRVSSSK